MPAMKSFSELIQMASRPPMVRIAIAGADEVEVLEASAECCRLGLAEPILIGPEGRIRDLAAEAGIDLGGCQIEGCDTPPAIALATMEAVKCGRAQVAVKGLVPTSTFLHAALDRTLGLRTDQLVSHVGLFQIPGFSRLLCISDGGVVVSPTLEQKIEIIRNAVAVAKTFVPRPRVALLAGSNEVTPDRVVTQEIASLVAMRSLWAAIDAYVDGPFTPDVAVDPAAAVVAGKTGEVAGQADVLVGPDVESVNTMCKGIIYFAGGQMAGLVTGARAPLALGSRSDPAEARLACIAIGVLFAKRRL